MKVLFFQLWYDYLGGAETVNDTLANQFCLDNFNVEILCMWKSDKNELITNNKYKKNFIAKKKTRKSYKIMLNDLKKGKILKIISDLLYNFNYYIYLYKNKIKAKKQIKLINPNYLIITNPELIKIIPNKFIKKCIFHMHCASDFYFQPENKKILKILNKYKSKVYKFVWLTPNFMNYAVNKGFKNSISIYNPVKFTTTTTSNLEQKNITYIGRIAYPKRVELLADIVNLIDNDYNLNIYGSGDIESIKCGRKVKLKGITNDVKHVLLETSIFALTSSSEGFPMVILEAYECGVPVIAYDFSISSNEIIKNGLTGFIIPMNNQEEYIKKLKLLCSDDELRKKMGKEAKKFVVNFESKKIVKNWYKLFGGEK